MSQVQAIVKSTESKALQESSPQNHELTPPPPQYTAACLCRARVTLRDLFRTSCLTNLFSAQQVTPKAVLVWLTTLELPKKNVPFWIWESLVLTLTRKWSSECSQLFLAHVSKSSKCLGMTSCYAIYISNLLQMPQPRYAASKGQCISFLWTCARNAFRKFLPNQQQTQQIKVINLPPKQWSFSLSFSLAPSMKLHQKVFWGHKSHLNIDLVTWDWCLRFSVATIRN